MVLQSALRGHLLRESQLNNLLKSTPNKATKAASLGEMDAVALTMIQSAFRGHLARCSPTIESSGFSVPSSMENKLPAMSSRRARLTQTARIGGASNRNDEGVPDNLQTLSSNRDSRLTPTKGQTDLHHNAECGGAAGVDSDDSDDIIVSPSRPLRRREVLIL